MRGREQRGVADRPAAKRIDLRGQMPVAADGLGEVDGADDNGQVPGFRGACFLDWSRGSAPRASGPHRFAVRGVYCGLGGSAGGVHWRKKARAALSTDCGSRWNFS